MAGDRPTLTVDGRELPAGWIVGEFELDVAELSAGKWDEAAGLLREVAGWAWLRLPCARAPIFNVGHLERPDLSTLKHAVEVVSEVFNPQTQISLDEARHLRPDIQVGETLDLDLALDRRALQEVVQLRRGVHDWLGTEPTAARFPVEFSDLTVSFGEPGQGPGRVVEGVVMYPAERPFRGPIEIDLDGFVLTITTLELTPHGSTALAQVRLPGGIADVDSCKPATIDLGAITMSPRCDFYVDEPARPYGPWLLGDTGMVFEGTGFVLDLSANQSPPPWPAAWKGLALGGGTASGDKFVPDPCNTGYLRGLYAYPDAIVVSSGFSGTLELVHPCTFNALNPLGQSVTVNHGFLDVRNSAIAAGEFQTGSTKLPPDAVCHGIVGTRVAVPIDVVSVQPDLDLAGVVDYGGSEMSWGELTRHGDEVVAWSASFGLGYLFLPAGPYASYSPVASGVFSGPSIDSTPDSSLSSLDAAHAAGVSFPALTDIQVFSPDRPHGTANPIKFARLQGWLRVGITGVDGALSIFQQSRPEELGDPTRAGYVGKIPFKASLFINDKWNLIAEFVTSASFDSNFGGFFDIPPPCGVPRLGFEQMKLTSTSCLVGGEVVLPSGGVKLQLWDLDLVPTGPPNQTGVVSVRTGRVVFTAAGLAEPVHFAQPFGLTWGEMLADGNLGELDLDFNNWGQRFDGLVFNPHDLTLAPGTAAAHDPYLGVSGSICFPFFGVHQVNIRDASDQRSGASPFPRHVTVPKAPITPRSLPTDLALSGTWDDITSSQLAAFDCLDVDVDYNEPSQLGFIATGTAELAFLHSDPLVITVEIHSDATDIHFSATDTHDLDVGLFARLGGIAQIAGCARIEGPLLTHMSIYGMLEDSQAAGAIFGPKPGYEVEINISVTPTCFNFYASGDFLLSVATVDLEASATAHLVVDWGMGFAEGELIGRINCDAAVAGLSGEGQLTWHVGSTMQYLQGRVKVAVCSWTSAGLEGGFFVGDNVPKELAWVLDPTDTHFGMSRAILPMNLTGVYGYGQLSVGFNVAVFGGGIDIFVGAGAFVTAPAGLVTPFPGPAGLPYVVGTCAIYVHGEILGGLVSASAWANLSLRGPIPTYFEGSFGLQGCALWVLCASVTVTAGINGSGLYLHP
jgi:hypothetical protein